MPLQTWLAGASGWLTVWCYVVALVHVVLIRHLTCMYCTCRQPRTTWSESNWNIKNFNSHRFEMKSDRVRWLVPPALTMLSPWRSVDVVIQDCFGRVQWLSGQMPQRQQNQDQGKSSGNLFADNRSWETRICAGIGRLVLTRRYFAVLFPVAYFFLAKNV